MGCRLCTSSQDLCRSHILPEFLYRLLYDDKHRFSILEKGIIGSRYGQRGLSEKLLCRACEQRFSAHEKYAADVMRGRLGHRAQVIGNEILIHDVDYAPFKLFQLSILWRASVSTLDFFRLVSLGPREELLRKIGVTPFRWTVEGCRHQH